MFSPPVRFLTIKKQYVPTHIESLTSFKEAVAQVPIRGLNLARMGALHRQEPRLNVQCDLIEAGYENFLLSLGAAFLGAGR